MFQRPEIDRKSFREETGFKSPNIHMPKCIQIDKREVLPIKGNLVQNEEVRSDLIHRGASEIYLNQLESVSSRGKMRNDSVRSIHFSSLPINHPVPY